MVYLLNVNAGPHPYEVLVETYLMLPDGSANLVGEIVEDLAIVVTRDVLPDPAQQAAVGGGEI